MAETLPMNFPIPSSPAVASYNWTDFLQSLGYVRFYLGVQEDSGGYGYFASTQAIPSTKEKTFIRNSGAGDTVYNFDADVTNPFILEAADCFFSYVTFQATGTGGRNFVVTCAVVHYDGSTETSLGSATLTEQMTASEIKRGLFKFAITRKKFKPGDTLRIKITLNDDEEQMYVEPSGRLSLTETTTSATLGGDTYIDIPFRIDT